MNFTNIILNSIMDHFPIINYKHKSYNIKYPKEFGISQNYYLLAVLPVTTSREISCVTPWRVYLL